MAALIPLGDVSRRRARFPIATTAIIVLNALVFFLELKGGDQFVYEWAAIPANIVSGHALPTLLTSMFIHGSWSHILGNMVFLWAFGPAMEDIMNPWRFTAFYLLGGLVAMLAQVAASPTSMIPTLGASGAIAAVMGAFLVTYPRDRIRAIFWLIFFIRITYIPAIFLIGFWFLIQVLNVGSVASVQHGGVAYVAHVGGFLFGALTIRLFRGPKRYTQPPNTWPRY
ncbi:MAG: rhomboid family intramembrane serine protease [Acidobacteriaceae bacterium]